MLPSFKKSVIVHLVVTLGYCDAQVICPTDQRAIQLDVEVEQGAWCRKGWNISLAAYRNDPSPDLKSEKCNNKCCG